ncbi:MAG: tRNA (adenosine(37)-N6)-threonylcarbamoyltransferase complex transferase subunit TsaD, partial [Bdellovibrionales bacterium]|nr:tRNA (adenosine(37)-N6)-threonylcarbamoyltransferase complex transferase subunit TsaD [Bdellovibrionales bacterium]
EVQGLGQYKVLGQTLDDAAGEAFDKFAKMVGLGYPGGVKVDQEAQGGDIKAFAFPRALEKDPSLNFSFSGLKTSAANLIKGWDEEKILKHRKDLCASFQEAVVDALLNKFCRSAEEGDFLRVALTGGVSANSRLRFRAQQWADQKGIQLAVPPLKYCTDNAAMVGWAGFLRLQRGEQSSFQEGPSAQSLPGDFLRDE